jgi:hypothetical protein
MPRQVPGAVKDLQKELGPGLLSGMYKQLGIRKENL